MLFVSVLFLKTLQLVVFKKSLLRKKIRMIEILVIWWKSLERLVDNSNDESITPQKLALMFLFWSTIVVIVIFMIRAIFCLLVFMFRALREYIQPRASNEYK